MADDAVHDADDDGSTGDDEDEDDDLTMGNPKPVDVPASRPRARRAVAEKPEAVSPPSIFGAIPEGVTHWGVCKRNVGGVFEEVGWAAPGAGVELREWPIGDLSEDTLRDRWGPGHYQCSWIRPQPRGGRRTLRGGREVSILALPSKASAPALSPSSPLAALGETFGLAKELMGTIKSEAQATVDGWTQIAAIMGTQNRGGLGAAELELILQRSAASNQAAITAAVTLAVEPLREQNAALAARLAAIDDEDDDSPITDAVAAAAPTFIKSKSGWAQALNLAVAHPDATKKIAEGVLTGLAPAFMKIAEAFAKKPEPPAAKPAADEAERPRAKAVSRETPKSEEDEAWERLPVEGAARSSANGAARPAASPAAAPVAAAPADMG